MIWILETDMLMGKVKLLTQFKKFAQKIGHYVDLGSSRSNYRLKLSAENRHISYELKLLEQFKSS